MFVIGQFFDYGVAWGIHETGFITTKPGPLPNYMAILRPFSISVWVTFLALLLLLGAAFWLMHYFYTEKIGLRSPVVRPAQSKTDFLLFSIARITEPDPLPWFPTWGTKAGDHSTGEGYLSYLSNTSGSISASTLLFLIFFLGKCLILSWSILSLVMILSYGCNLRAFLISRDLKEAMDTTDDVVSTSRTVFVSKSQNNFKWVQTL